MTEPRPTYGTAPPVRTGGVPRAARRRKVAQGAVLTGDEVRAGETEAHFQARVLELARVRGWTEFVLPRYAVSCDRCGHPVKWGQAVASGWPDVVLFRSGAAPRIVALELKSARGALSQAQANWLLLLILCGVDARMVRPEAWAEIEEVLA